VLVKKGRLVVVSNRVPNLDAEGRAEEVFASFGLVNALVAVMSEVESGLWMGWSGRVVSEKSSGHLEEREYERMRLVGLDLSEKDAEVLQHGFGHRTLWPLCHLFQTNVLLDQHDQEAYFKVNERIAQTLADLLEPQDMVWVNDYHLVPLGRYLRQEGFRGPLGFFLHVPFPPVEMIEVLTDPLGFMDAWLYYDLVGFHTDRYVENYFEVMARMMLGVREGERLFAGNRKQRVLTCPIGINPQTFDPHHEANKNAAGKSLTTLIPGCKIILGVDRLDYTKGITERLHSFEYFLRRYSGWRRKASLVQVCSPSRTRVKEYRAQKEEVDALVGRINGELADHDWTPIRYLYRNYGTQELARFYRDADVGLVTPLRDGMNLVALEYVAAQDPADPGVLVLSRFTGAAEFLHEAVLVNPFVPESVAEGIDRALTMSLRERQDRHQSMSDFVSRNTVSHWANSFLNALVKAHQDHLTL
jgi:trehalose 6-phosphate synthase